MKGNPQSFIHFFFKMHIVGIMELMKELKEMNTDIPGD